MRDPFQILGVPRGADAAEVRSAYRRLARLHHPDVSKAPDAARRFAEIADAYQRLTDPRFRDRIDLVHPMPRSDPAVDTIDAQAAGEVYDAFFNDAARTAPPRRRAAPPPWRTIAGSHDLLIVLPVSVLEAALGATIPVPTPRGPADVTVPPATVGGSRLKITGHGAADRAGQRGDLFVEILIIPGSGGVPSVP